MRRRKVGRNRERERWREEEAGRGEERWKRGKWPQLAMSFECLWLEVS